jgi:hypothetical protein
MTDGAGAAGSFRHSQVHHLPGTAVTPGGCVGPSRASIKLGERDHYRRQWMAPPLVYIPSIE